MATQVSSKESFCSILPEQGTTIFDFNEEDLKNRGISKERCLAHYNTLLDQNVSCTVIGASLQQLVNLSRDAAKKGLYREGQFNTFGQLDVSCPSPLSTGHLVTGTCPMDPNCRLEPHSFVTFRDNKDQITLSLKQIHLIRMHGIFPEKNPYYQQGETDPDRLCNLLHLTPRHSVHTTKAWRYRDLFMLGDDKESADEEEIQKYAHQLIAIDQFARAYLGVPFKGPQAPKIFEKGESYCYLFNQERRDLQKNPIRNLDGIPLEDPVWAQGAHVFELVDRPLVIKRE
ncbi:MAG: hypothetical protein KGJ02_00620 [Verrucomicrobiota bacterium]|nr:hypothetical protein [Verrucomicrobiota bacterium]